MSDAHNEHESAIKTPKQLIVAVVAAFLVPITCIVLLVQYVTSDQKESAGFTKEQTSEAIEARIHPVADNGFTLKDANAPKQLQTGEAVYTSTCSGCHASGALGAPKFGDAGAWGPRIAQGYDTLLSHALKGIRAMPAKGGNADLDDVEVARAMVYMADKAGAKFPEPAAPAPKAAAAEKSK
jgi:cytochrome c5